MKYINLILMLAISIIISNEVMALPKASFGSCYDGTNYTLTVYNKGTAGYIAYDIYGKTGKVDLGYFDENEMKRVVVTQSGTLRKFVKDQPADNWQQKGGTHTLSSNGSACPVPKHSGGGNNTDGTNFVISAVNNGDAGYLGYKVGSGSVVDLGFFKAGERKYYKVPVSGNENAVIGKMSRAFPELDWKQNGTHTLNANTATNADFRVYLKDSKGNAITEGASLRYHDGAWKDATFYAGHFWIPATPTAKKIILQMTYNNGRRQVSNVMSKSGDEYVMNTTLVDLSLLDSDDNDIDGETMRFHQITWKDLDISNGPVELLPGKYTFQMTYNNGRRQIVSTVPVAETHRVNFRTVSTDLSLLDSDGNDIDGETMRFHQVTWKDLDISNGPVELLPGKYTFQMTYNNGRRQIVSTLPVAAETRVDFRTVSTDLSLLDSDGNDIDGETMRFHQVTWRDLDISGGDVELLPGKYTFQMTYNNGRQQKVVTLPVAADTRVDFRTIPSQMILEDSEGNMLEGGNIRFHQVTWKDLGDANDVYQLLPGKYTFQLTHNNGRSQKVVTISNANPNVEWNTYSVNFCYSGNVRFHQVTWKDFEKGGMELLPGKYTFSFDGRSVGAKTIYDDMMGYYIVTELRSSNNGYISGADVSIQARLNNEGTRTGYEELTAGTTSGGRHYYYFDNNTHLLWDKNVRVLVDYNRHTTNRTQNTTKDSYFDFKTTGATVALLDADGKGVSGKTVSYRKGGDYSEIGTTNSRGEVNIELFNTTYEFKADFGGDNDIACKSQNIGKDPRVVFSRVNGSAVLYASYNNDEGVKPGLDGAEFEYYYKGNWTPLGTSTNGSVEFSLFDIKANFRVRYMGKTSQLNNFDLSSNNSVEFYAQNDPPTVIYQDINGNPIADNETSVKVYYKENKDDTNPWEELVAKNW